MLTRHLQHPVTDIRLARSLNLQHYVTVVSAWKLESLGWSPVNIFKSHWAKEPVSVTVEIVPRFSSPGHILISVVPETSWSHHGLIMAKSWFHHGVLFIFCRQYIIIDSTYLPILCKSYLLAYLLTPLSRVLLKKLTVFQLVKKFLAFYGTDGSFPPSQVLATCPYPEPARSSPYPHNPLHENPSQYYPPI